MNKQALIEKLEKIIVERTPHYGDIDGRVKYDEELMKYNYILAKIYSQERHIVKARIYLRNAEHQLVCFNDTLQQKIKPVNMEEEKKSKCPPYDLERVLERTRKREKEGKKFHHWFKKIFELRDELQ